MPLDAVCLTALVDELAPQLEGAHIDKVQPPARDLLLLSLYTRQGSRKLLISAGVGMARLHLTAERFENPETPPMFCMLLRKHLVGARIDALTQPENERMVILELTARDELGVETKKTPRRGADGPLVERRPRGRGGGHHRLPAPRGLRRGGLPPPVARHAIPPASQTGKA